MSKTINPARILHEDDHLLAVNKLSRELVVKGKGPVDTLPLLDFLRLTYGSSLKPLHRLDFETSGVVLFAKSKECFEEAVTKKAFVKEEGGAEKTYRAIVMGHMKPPKGIIDDPLPARNSRDLLPASTAYRVLQTFGDTSFVEAVIRAGRHHQIRRHFAAVDHPLVNDQLYGNKTFNRLFARTFRFRYFFLHAWRVDLTHFVTGERLAIQAPLPQSFEKALRSLAS